MNDRKTREREREGGNVRPNAFLYQCGWTCFFFVTHDAKNTAGWAELIKTVKGADVF